MQVPISRSLVVPDARIPHWKVLPYFDRYQSFFFKNLSEENEPENEAEKLRCVFISRHDDIQRAPPFQIQLLRLKGYDLCTIRLHASCFDSRAAIFFVAELCKCYQRFEKESEWIPQIPSFDVQKIRPELYPRINRFPFPDFKEMLGGEIPENPVLFDQPAGTGELADFVSMNIMGDDYQNLFSRCKSIKVSLGDAVLAAILIALKEQNDTRQVYPRELKTIFMAESKVIENLPLASFHASSPWLLHLPLKASSFIIAARLIADLKANIPLRNIQDTYGVSMAVPFKLFRFAVKTLAQGLRNGLSHYILFDSAGSFPSMLKTLGDVEITGIHLANSIIPVHLPVFNVIRFGKSLSITINCHQEVFNKADMEQFARKVRQILISA